MRKRRWLTLGATGVAALIVLGACSGGDDVHQVNAPDDNAPAMTPSGAATADAVGEAVGPETDLASVDLATARRPDDDREVIRTAELTLETRHATAAADEAKQIADAAGGFLYSQSADRSTGGMVLSVFKIPPGRFDDVIAQFEKLGQVSERHIGTDDVTGQVVDLQARLDSTRASVTRLRELLSKSGNVADLLTVEGQLSSREAEMESLAAQLESLRAQVDLATITVSLIEPAPVVKVKANVDHSIPGFLEGTRRGAAAFANGFLVVSTGVGMVLPFLALALVVAIPARMFTRRRRTHPTPA